jgi:hypothetical protein
LLPAGRPTFDSREKHRQYDRENELLTLYKELVVADITLLCQCLLGETEKIQEKIRISDVRARFQAVIFRI